MKTTKLWIARDKDGDLYIYTNKPIKYDLEGYFGVNGGEREYIVDIEYLFSEVTWENSPQQIELKLCNMDFDRILEENKDVLKRMKESDN